MAKYEIKLVRRQEIAAGTMSFFFEKPAGFIYKAGQNGDWALIDPPETDAEGNMRTFTFTSAPFEPELEIATRMRDTAFKRVLASMPLGTTVALDGPMGSMTLHNNTARPAVFIAGGIGVTPFLSMIREATHQRLPHRIFFFYSNRRPADAAFLRELGDLQNENRNYQLIATMTQADEESWGGETGYIDGAMIKKYVGDIAAPIYYLAGPPAMTAAMRGMLNGIGVNDDDIRAEDFAGY